MHDNISLDFLLKWNLSDCGLLNDDHLLDQSCVLPVQIPLMGSEIPYWDSKGTGGQNHAHQRYVSLMRVQGQLRFVA